MDSGIEYSPAQSNIDFCVFHVAYVSFRLRMHFISLLFVFGLPMITFVSLNVYLVDGSCVSRWLMIIIDNKMWNIYIFAQMHVILLQIEIEILIRMEIVFRCFVSIFRFSWEPFIDWFSLVDFNRTHWLLILLLLLSKRMCNVHSHWKMMRQKLF